MKTIKILGLDLGVSSIGWAYTKENEDTIEVLGLGARVIILEADEKDKFIKGQSFKGQSFSKNQKRTTKRSQRRGYDRYQLRKKNLSSILKEQNLFPDKKLFSLTALELYGLRDKAISQRIELQEFGRIFFHLNQKRGYKSSRKDQQKDQQKDAKIAAYESEIKKRDEQINEQHITIGQFFYQQLQTDNQFRIKENIFSRSTYIDEFDAIWNEQQNHYPNILTNDLKKEIRDKTIYYQRPLKSQKGLVSICEFEGKTYETKEGKNVFSGPKVAPKSSPLFQVCKIWESINNITIKNKRGEPFLLSLDQKNEIFEYLDHNKELSETDLFKILEISKKEGYYTNALPFRKGLQGNLTKSPILKILDGCDKLEEICQFNLRSEEYINTNTGEINRKKITIDFEKEPLYRLWHILYSIQEDKDIISTLQKEFSLSKEEAEKLLSLDFTKDGFGNKSSRAIRKILPYLQQGMVYSDACNHAGYNHSNSITKEENTIRLLQDNLQLLPKNSLRQPTVEKILNQLINLVNTLIADPQYGRPDEIRIELARELKQSKNERLSTYKRNEQAETDHIKIREKLSENPEFQKKKISRNDIIRYKLWEEFNGRSPYEPGKQIGIAELYSGEYDIEHIIPKSRRFDDSFNNKTICHRRYNSGEFAKNQMTGYDFMQQKWGEEAFQLYLTSIDDAYKNKKISKTKRDNLLKKEEDIEDDFINRQLNETRYISKKAKEILTDVCRNVWTTTGQITDYLRHYWGYDEILRDLNWDKYSDEEKQIDVLENGQKKYSIKNWSKRDDHRHHAIDALVIASTKQSIIQRLNNLNQSVKVKKDQTKYDAVKSDESLTTFTQKQQPLPTVQVKDLVSQILISFKSGKKVATFSKRKVKKHGKWKVVQENIITPRGALSEESVYGKIKRYQKNKKGSISYTEECVIKYKVDTLFDKKNEEQIKNKTLPSIVDKGIRNILQARLEEHNYNSKEAFKNLKENPVWLNEEKRIPIKSVRCFTGSKTLKPIITKDDIAKIEYEKYVQPGNNHHLSLYINEKGKKEKHFVTFWHAVERKKYGIPVIIKNPKEVWDLVRNKNLPQDFLDKLPESNWIYECSMQQNEMFVFDLNKEQMEEYIKHNQYQNISDYLYRVKSIGITGWNSQFVQHLIPKIPKGYEKLINKDKKFKGFSSFEKFNGIKVKINYLGKITKIGE